MHRRNWDAKTKAMIGPEGLTGKPVAEICTEHQRSQALYDQGRDQFLAHAFEVDRPTRQEARRAQEHTRLKKLVGGLLLECNTSDERLG